MKKNVKSIAKREYEDLDWKIGKRVDDFLPTPAELAEVEDNVRITICFSRKSIEFFKAQAKAKNSQYQRMIRKLVDSYAERHATV